MPLLAPPFEGDTQKCATKSIWPARYLNVWKLALSSKTSYMKTSLCSATDAVDSTTTKHTAQRVCRTQPWYLIILNHIPQPYHHLNQPTCQLPRKQSKRIAPKHVDIHLRQLHAVRTPQLIITPWIIHVVWQHHHMHSGSALTKLMQWWDNRSIVQSSHLGLTVARWHPRVKTFTYYSHVRKKGSACMNQVRLVVPGFLSKRAMWLWITWALLAWPAVLLNANILFTLMPCSKSTI